MNSEQLSMLRNILRDKREKYNEALAKAEEAFIYYQNASHAEKDDALDDLLNALEERELAKTEWLEAGDMVNNLLGV